MNGAIWANEKATTEGMVSFMTASFEEKLERQVRNWKDESINLRKNDIIKAVLILNKMQEEMFFSEGAEMTKKEKELGIADLPRVGAATAEKLKESGFETLMAIAVATPGSL